MNLNSLFSEMLQINRKMLQINNLSVTQNTPNIQQVMRNVTDVTLLQNFSMRAYFL